MNKSNLIDAVSVIVPAFNRASTVARALDSILSQTYGNWEAIVVDDGSTDDTAEIVERYAGRDRRFHLIRHEKTRGAQAARNTGIKAARGKWIAFLDSDDEWLPHSLEARLQLAVDKRVDVVHCDCYVVEAGVAGRRRFGVPAMAGRVYETLLTQPGPVFPGLLVAKSALEEIGYLDEEIVAFQEWDTAIRLAKVREFEFIDEPLFLYYIHGGATISKNSSGNFKGYQQVVEKHAHDIERLCGARVLANHYKAIAGLAYDDGDVALAKKFLAKASHAAPLDLQILARRLLLHLNRKLYDLIINSYKRLKRRPKKTSQGSS